MPFAIAAGIGAAGSVLSGFLGGSSASAASKAEAAEQNIALQNQATELNYQNTLNAPYIGTGTNALNNFGNYWQTTQNALNGAMPGTMTMEQLQSTPGYQFAAAQGSRSIMNAAAAKGLGVSSAALTGLNAYNVGLASQTYQQQFANQQQRYADTANTAQTTFNQLSAPVTVGASVLGAQGTNSTNSLNNQSATLNNLGQTQAAGITGQAAGLNSAISGAANAPLNYLGLQSVLGNNNAAKSGNVDPGDGSLSLGTS